jgi:hypothetical protein
MKSMLAVCLVTGVMTASATSAMCEERAQVAGEAERAEAIDCSKQNWPNFSPTCLRNGGQATTVRIITADRR